MAHELHIASIRADLHRYFRQRQPRFSSGFSAVVADVIALANALIRGGLETALERLPGLTEDLESRPFIEVADKIVDHHLRLVGAADVEAVRKSLLEAYLHAAGPQYVFGPPRRTLLRRSLRRWGPRNFGALLFSLYVFNMVRAVIEEQVFNVHSIKDFELYMLTVETICRDAVKTAVQAVAGNHCEEDEQWAKAIEANIEIQLFLHSKLAS